VRSRGCFEERREVLRHCTKCGEDRPDSEFYKGLKNRLCKKHYCEYTAACRRRYQKDPKYRERSWAAGLKTRLGVEFTAYNALLDSQGHLCKICGKPDGDGTSYQTKRLALDHCHATGKVRGLLCEQCNKGLGMFKDRPELLQKAIEYLS
jgi:hypothetical protein